MNISGKHIASAFRGKINNIDLFHCQNFKSYTASNQALTDTSSPSSSSSTTTVLPELPNLCSVSMLCTALHASDREDATTTPFPAASPLAFTTNAK
jgi:hypothetical protein